jgi:hypothetical protein
MCARLASTPASIELPAIPSVPRPDQRAEHEYYDNEGIAQPSTVMAADNTTEHTLAVLGTLDLARFAMAGVVIRAHVRTLGLHAGVQTSAPNMNTMTTKASLSPQQ